MGDEQKLHGGKAAHFCQSSLGEIGHEDDGHDDLVGRKAQEKGHEDHAVQPHESGKWIQKGSAPGEQACVQDVQVGHAPDEKSRRHCYGCCAAQHKQGAVEDRADQDRSDLRLPVGRQLQCVGRGNPLQPCGREQPGHGKGHADPEKDCKSKQKRG